MPKFLFGFLDDCSILMMETYQDRTIEAAITKLIVEVQFPELPSSSLPHYIGTDPKQASRSRHWLNTCSKSGWRNNKKDSHSPESFRLRNKFAAPLFSLDMLTLSPCTTMKITSFSIASIHINAAQLQLVL